MLLSLRMILAVTGMPHPSPGGIWATSRVDCVTRCYRDRSCSSLFYDKTTIMCYLLNTVYDELERDRFDAPWDKTYLIWKRDTCTGGYTWIKSLNICYKIYPDERAWADADDMCRQDGGQLVKVESAEKNALFKRIAYTTGHSYWLGGTDREQEGTWLWSDGVPLSLNYWAPDQPNGYKKQNCLVIASRDDYITKAWFDWSCSKEKPFVCEISLLYEIYSDPVCVL